MCLQKRAFSFSGGSYVATVSKARRPDTIIPSPEWCPDVHAEVHLSLGALTSGSG